VGVAEVILVGRKRRYPAGSPSMLALRTTWGCRKMTQFLLVDLSSR